MVRVKRRYLVCEVIITSEVMHFVLRDLELYQAVSAAVAKAHGDYGMGLMKSSLNVKYLNMGSGMAFIRIKRGAQSMLQSALTFVKKIGGIEASLRTLHIAGTVRSCQKFLIKYHKQQLPEMLKYCKTPEERMEVQMSIRKACEAVDMYKYHSENQGLQEGEDT